jgi:hypothetical protein
MRFWNRCARSASVAASALAVAACGAGPFQPAGPPAPGPLASLPQGNPARLEVRRLDARPRLTLITRDGDPAPAVAAVLVTGAGPALTTALAAVVESRLRATGFEAEVRVDRDAFRARLLLPDAARAAPFLAALASAATRPIAAGSPEIALAVQRLQSLKRNPLDAAELVPVAACTGTLGLAPGEAVPDLAAEAGLRDLEAARRAIHAGRISVAAVGPAAFTAAVTQALERSSGWPPPVAVPDEPPAAEIPPSVYVAPSLDRRSARVTVALRVPDPEVAAAAAERLGAPESPLSARLRMLPEGWRLAQVAGVARTQGGCLSAVLETSQHPPGQPLEAPAALVAAIARREITAEIAAGGNQAAGRQILAAGDPREAAARAAWWALAGAAPAAPPKWITVLGVPPADRGPRDTGSARFAAELDRALAVPAGAERRLAVERGQGEIWMLLASTCGVADEGPLDAGLGALSLLASLEARRRATDVTLEPWITSDGLGVVAHAALRDERETVTDLARRVADAAARALTATTPPPEAVVAARAVALDHLERTTGHHGAAFEPLAGALAPDHPSWVDPFGLFRRVAEAAGESVRGRGQALAFGPIRLAVLANADPAQAAAAADEVDRWLTPAAPRVCRAGTASAARAGRFDVRLPSDAPLAQGMLGVPLPQPATPVPGPYAYRDLADLTAAALDGPGGLLAGALAADAAAASARVLGGARAPALVVEVRAPDAGLSSAVSDVKALLLRLPSTATEGDLARAAGIVERREQDARADPRRRLADLWSGRRPSAPGRPSLTAWRAFLGAALREPALVVVEAHAP